MNIHVMAIRFESDQPNNAHMSNFQNILFGFLTQLKIQKSVTQH